MHFEELSIYFDSGGNSRDLFKKSCFIKATPMMIIREDNTSIATLHIKDFGWTKNSRLQVSTMSPCRDSDHWAILLPISCRAEFKSLDNRSYLQVSCTDFLVNVSVEVTISDLSITNTSGYI